MKDFEVKNISDTAAEVWIYNEIIAERGLFDGNATNATELARQITELTAKKITVHINSPGGSCYGGFAIYSALMRQRRENSATVNVVIDGLAASAASVVAMAGNTISCAQCGAVMIHRASTVAWGNCAALEREAKQLRDLDVQIATIYADRTGKTRAEIEEKLVGSDGNDGTFFSAEEALEFGLITEINANAKAVALLHPEQLEQYANRLPEDYTKMTRSTKKRQFEEDLRDAGCSRGVAVCIASGHADRVKLVEEPAVVQKYDIDLGKFDAVIKSMKQKEN